jgi:hypothetical protein
MGRGVGDSFEPHAARPGGDSVQEGSGLVSGPKVHQLRGTLCVEGTANECGQLSKRRGGCHTEAICGRWAGTTNSAVNVSPGIKCGAVGGCIGVQVGGGSGEGSGRTRRRGKEGGKACYWGKLVKLKPPSGGRR